MEKDALGPQLDLDNVGPEVKSYIYQILSEFEPYTTPETTVAVIAKDPLALRKKEDAGDLPPKAELARMYRISITLHEDGTKLEAEGLDADIFAALRKAKDNLLATLIEIHDKVVDNKERNQQIHSALNSGQLH
ncbi:MAG: hypothetical protein KF767_01670 [Bdellovibrionaceae bacterium]|nr:hypothetical protein [Pseudobdellovibrionaceae bacterium]